MTPGAQVGEQPCKRHPGLLARRVIPGRVDGGARRDRQTSAVRRARRGKAFGHASHPYAARNPEGLLVRTHYQPYTKLRS